MRSADGTANELRAARRWPPGRCRILGAGASIAIPPLAPRVVEKRFGARRREARPRWKTAVRSKSIALQQSACVPSRGQARRRGLPGPDGSYHGCRSARSALGVPAIVPGGGPLVAARSPAAADVPAPGQRARGRRRREIIGGTILTLRPSVRSGGLHRHDRPVRRRSQRGLRPASPTTCWRSSSASARNKGCTVARGGLARRSGRASPLGGSWLRSFGLADDQVRGRPAGGRELGSVMNSAVQQRLRRRQASRY